MEERLKRSLLNTIGVQTKNQKYTANQEKERRLFRERIQREEENRINNQKQMDEDVTEYTNTGWVRTGIGITGVEKELRQVYPTAKRVNLETIFTDRDVDSANEQNNKLQNMEIIIVTRKDVQYGDLTPLRFAKFESVGMFKKFTVKSDKTDYPYIYFLYLTTDTTPNIFIESERGKDSDDRFPKGISSTDKLLYYVPPSPAADPAITDLAQNKITYEGGKRRRTKSYKKRRRNINYSKKRPNKRGYSARLYRRRRTK